MIIDSETRNGYFSSNRAGGKGEDDIYGLYLEEKPAIKIKGNTFWRTDEEDVYSRKGLEDVKISIVNLTSGAFENLYSDENGSFELALKPGSKYEITASKGSLITSVASIDLKNSQIKRINPIEMVLVKPLPKPTEVILEGKLIDAKTNKGLANTNFYLLNSTTKKVQKVTTDAEGKYNLKLDPSTNYSLKAAPAGYLVNCTSFSTPVADKDPYTTITPLKLEKLELNKKIEVENLYYDVNQFNIRPDAAVELDKVVQFMKDNSNITIELGAHTDSRGSSTANADLSAKRAKAARDYVVSKGISDQNITFKGYGESQLLNKCKDGVKCEDDLHADNRRTEIKITGIKKDVKSVVAIDESNAFDLDNEINCNNIEIIKK
jgi:outer membrane protein OmpA-like peptidoglycan-associated protein